MKQVVIHTTVCFLFVKIIFAQNIPYTDAYPAAVFYSPVFNGYYKKLNVVGGNKTQWMSLGFPFSTSYLNLESVLHISSQGNVLMGNLFVTNEKAGVVGVNNNFVKGSLSYYSIDDEFSFGAGIGFIYKNKKVDFHNAAWQTQYNGTKFDPNLHSQESIINNPVNAFYFPVGISLIFYNSKKYEIGDKFKRFYIHLTFTGDGNNTPFLSTHQYDSISEKGKTPSLISFLHYIRGIKDKPLLYEILFYFQDRTVKFEPSNASLSFFLKYFFREQHYAGIGASIRNASFAGHLTYNINRFGLIFTYEQFWGAELVNSPSIGNTIKSANAFELTLSYTIPYDEPSRKNYDDYTPSKKKKYYKLKKRINIYE